MATRSRIPAAPPPIGRTVGDTLALVGFTNTSPTVATVDAADTGKILLGDTWTLAAVAGETAAMEAVDGASATVDAIAGADVTLAVDLSAVDVTALAATATVSAEAPAPSPSPPPIPAPGSDAERILTSAPSPGISTLPVEPHPADGFPGLSSDGLSAPNPEDPTGPALTGTALEAAIAAWKAKRRAALDFLHIPPPPPPRGAE